LSTGAFHYIRVQPRDTVNIYQVGSAYYYNNSMDQVTRLNNNTIYYIYDSLEVDAKPSGYYLDGQDGYANSAVKRRVKDINYNFRIAGMKEGQIVDFNGQGVTTGRYEALTNLSEVKEMYAGNGLILDIVY